MSDAPRPTLKLKFGKRPDPPAEPKPEPTSTPTPSQSSQPKIKLKIGRKPEPAPAAEQEKPKKKKPSKKRPAENAASAEPAAAPENTFKRLKINPSKKPGVQSIRLKNKGTVAHRPVGVGYDSEASDTEADPSIEEQFILRMPPGEDCEYLRKVINDKTFDQSQVSFKPLNREGRRAVLKIRDKQYAASLVDLPCIIEGMKSWDRRGWYKSADICQMLLVLGLVSNDQEALEYPIPPEVEQPDEKTLQYPHGLAPPLRWVRKRRFRDRVSSRTIEQVEKAVEDLVAQDSGSIFPPRFELVDSTSLNRAEGFVQSGDYEEEDYYDQYQDAEGEADEEMMGDLEDELAAEMEAALAAEDDAPADEAEQVGTPSAKPSTPAGAPTETAQGDSSGDESNESEDGGAEDLDDEQLEQQRQLQQQREEIGELETLIRTETAAWEKVQNHILRNKMGRRIQELKKDLDLKKVSAGIGDNDL
ncbi:TAFII55 protein conserved region-domain-containing protein [Penicillium capsulatum]|uniref:TAFII55 protein conserved region-domain-containing protein n=1 Tax=Penicillium capsulatum TaxID=69766 RepID=A0A9W9ITR8_9EURO|nr:TAFII55 protein conserved region-domain-containing protein [Penicillium capsulatum]KAJ6129456.1 TAFII55 protein conserved region-domain-containing protein [Penicillium capsulatum]